MKKIRLNWTNTKLKSENPPKKSLPGNSWIKETIEYKREKERGRIEAEIKEGVDVGKRKRKRSNI